MTPKDNMTPKTLRVKVNQGRLTLSEKRWVCSCGWVNCKQFCAKCGRWAS